LKRCRESSGNENLKLKKDGKKDVPIEGEIATISREDKESAIQGRQEAKKRKRDRRKRRDTKRGRKKQRDEMQPSGRRRKIKKEERELRR